MSRVERKKELLLRENEKLKADFKSQKRNSNASQLINNPSALNFMRNTQIQTNVQSLSQVERERMSALNDSQLHTNRFSAQLNTSKFANLPENQSSYRYTNQKILNESINNDNDSL